MGRLSSRFPVLVLQTSRRGCFVICCNELGCLVRRPDVDVPLQSFHANSETVEVT